MSAQMDIHAMREPAIEKVVVHMGVGSGGRALAHAEDILASLTGQEPVRTLADRTEPTFGIREGDPIGAKVTLRGSAAIAFLDQALPLAELSRSQFDETGNVSFGLPEHTEFPDQEYDPTVGIYGLDVTINLVRPGYRVKKRRVASRRIPASHRLTVSDAIEFLTSEFDVEVADE